MIDGQVVKDIVEAAPELFLVEIKAKGDDYEVVIDSDSRVSVQDCIRVTKAIEQKYDRDEADYSLTVTSAGIGEPLTHPRQFSKLEGRQVEVVFTNGKKRVGTLKEYNGKEIAVDDETFGMDEIKAVKEHITFS